MTEESTIIYKSKSFVLGQCQCGCKTEIPLRTRRNGGMLRRFVHNHHMRMKNHPNYKGYKINIWGYKLIRIPEHPYADCDGYVREHRLVMEQYLGRYLKPEEHIHHKNIHNLSKEQNKLDNTIDNLQLVTNSDHGKLSKKEWCEAYKTILENRLCDVCKGKTIFHKKRKVLCWFRNPLDKSQWTCNKCYKKIKRRMKKSEIERRRSKGGACKR